MPTVKDFKNKDGKWGMYIHMGLVRTLSYTKWSGMKSRCSPTQTSLPAYIGCIMSENFKDFQFFAEWCQNQTGYGLPGYELDKDILINGNRLYSEDTCIFVPKKLNLFFIQRTADRGPYPIGVSACKEPGRYQAHISIDSKLKRLGTFGSVQEAFAAYKVAKEFEARRWAEKLKDAAIDPRVIQRLQSWELQS
jgi:hypothetical protein